MYRGSAAEFHGREVEEPAGRAVWWLTAARPALVLGSSQRPDVVDERALARPGSSSSGVTAAAGRSCSCRVRCPGWTWSLPAGDPLWDADVGRAADWLGAVVGAGGGVVRRPRRRGPSGSDGPHAVVEPRLLRRTGPGRGAGGGRKLVGISQRRTRGWARFQCAVYRRWDPAALVALLRPPRPTVEELAGSVATLDVPDADLRAAFLAALP